MMKAMKHIIHVTILSAGGTNLLEGCYFIITITIVVSRLYLLSLDIDLNENEAKERQYLESSFSKTGFAVA